MAKKITPIYSLYDDCDLIYTTTSKARLLKVANKRSKQRVMNYGVPTKNLFYVNKTLLDVEEAECESIDFKYEVTVNAELQENEDTDEG